MDCNTITQLITNVGFPIFSFLLCGFALKYVYDKERQSLDDTIAKVGDLTAAVNHNTETISRLVGEVSEFHESRMNHTIDMGGNGHEGC